MLNGKRDLAVEEGIERLNGKGATRNGKKQLYVTEEAEHFLVGDDTRLTEGYWGDGGGKIHKPPGHEKESAIDGGSSRLQEGQDGGGGRSYDRDGIRKIVQLCSG